MTNRRFDKNDQDLFAFITGDWNPIHIDPIYARRTVAGAPVVHGVHLLLWALDIVADGAVFGVPIRLRVSFDRFVIVGEVATVRLMRYDPERIIIKVEAGGSTRCSIELTSGAPKAEAPQTSPKAEVFAPSRCAFDRSVLEIDGLSGRVSPSSPPHELAAMFPAAARWLGSEPCAALGATTQLVGMICPGLHSIFKGLDLSICQNHAPDGGSLQFVAGPVRHGLVAMEVAGGGIAGNLTAVVRTPVQRQPAMHECASLLPSDAFAGHTAIVAGASRGLGELTAKLLASGGARVIATWSEGEADAEAVADEIRQAGSFCKTIRYQIGNGADAIAALEDRPTHGYYFASPTIAAPASRFFDSARLRALERFFVDGFWEFGEALRARQSDVRLFYPSTVYIDRRPKGFAEYAMAKAAGEILCAQMNLQRAPLTVVSARLPRLPTDQTAGLYETEHADPIAVLLPLIREVQRY